MKLDDTEHNDAKRNHKPVNRGDISSRIFLKPSN